MTEPVGNQPRSLIPSNSHRERTAGPPPQAEAREKVTSVVTGKVILSKPPWYKRLGRSMVADDAETILGFVGKNILLPAVRDLVRNVIVGGTERALYGGSSTYGGRSGYTPYGARGGMVGDRRPLREQFGSGNEVRQPMTQMDRAQHNFGAVTLTDRGEAVHVIDRLHQLIAQYGTAAVADLYDLCNVTGSFMDREYGWTDLTDAGIVQTPDGWKLDLPAPRHLRR